MNRVFCIVLFTISPLIFLFSQKNEKLLKEDFLDAEYFLMMSEYKEALPLYKKLYRLDPDNANYRFRLGMCYLHTDHEKDFAIEHLEYASNYISHSYVEGSFKERKAPEFVYMFLGNAYRVNEQLDDAILAYRNFIKSSNEVF